MVAFCGAARAGVRPARTITTEPINDKRIGIASRLLVINTRYGRKFRVSR